MEYVYRMMSQQEYNDLIAGKTLTNTTVHDATHKFSYSTGFCFLPWIVECTWHKRLTNKTTVQAMDKITAMHAMDSLLPNVRKHDVWVQLKVLNPKVLKQSYGKYLDANTDRLVWIKEYCTTSYSIKDLCPMHAFSIQKVRDVQFMRWLGSN